MLEARIQDILARPLLKTSEVVSELASLVEDKVDDENARVEQIYTENWVRRQKANAAKTIQMRRAARTFHELRMADRAAQKVLFRNAPKLPKLPRRGWFKRWRASVKH